MFGYEKGNGLKGNSRYFKISEVKQEKEIKN